MRQIDTRRARELPGVAAVLTADDIPGARLHGLVLAMKNQVPVVAIDPMGDGVKISFRKPHALSATAVLEIESHHRTEPAVDAIVRHVKEQGGTVPEELSQTAGRIGDAGAGDVREVRDLRQPGGVQGHADERAHR